MTRPIRRGYPWPPHGRAVCYSGIHNLKGWQWAQLGKAMNRITASMSELSTSMFKAAAEVMQGIGDGIREGLVPLMEWFENLPPETRAQLEAGMAQQE